MTQTKRKDDVLPRELLLVAIVAPPLFASVFWSHPNVPVTRMIETVGTVWIYAGTLGVALHATFIPLARALYARKVSPAYRVIVYMALIVVLVTVLTLVTTPLLSIIQDVTYVRPISLAIRAAFLSAAYLIVGRGIARLRAGATVPAEPAPVAPPPPTSRPRIGRLGEGDTFDRYRIEEQLGEGGMGQVYKATDVKLRRAVALKLLRPTLADNESAWAEARARLLAEARVAATLAHPNVVTIFDVGEVDSIPFLTMELIRGRALREAVHGVGWVQTMKWLLQAAEALSAAHRAGIVHRDVKPENIMVREDGRVVVLDFGIARRNTGGEFESWRTAKGIALGTIVYMAPEQIELKDLDGRTDQFAWGVTAYELLAGCLPWPDSKNPFTLLTAVLCHDPAPLHTVARGLPEAISALVARAMSKSPSNRFATMDELIAGLALLLDKGVDSAPLVNDARWEAALAETVAANVSPNARSVPPGPLPTDD